MHAGSHPRVQAYVGLGSNLGGPRYQLIRALGELDRLPCTRCESYSSFYRSTPMGPGDQADYINAVARIETTLDPNELLVALQGLERAHRRVCGVRRWGPRTLDLDILIYGDVRLKGPRLWVPHPEIPRRDFVLYPLTELDPELVVPGLGPVEALVVACPRRGLERLR